MGGVRDEMMRGVAHVMLLFKKNVLVARRNKMATAAQVLVGVLFLALVALMQWSVNRLDRSLIAEDRHPDVNSAPGLRQCRVGPNTAGPGCYTFLYAPNNVSDPVGQLATSIASDMATAAALPGEGAYGGYLGFASADDIDTWLIANPNTTRAAVIFSSDGQNRTGDSLVSPDTVSYTLQVNETRTCQRLGVLLCDMPFLDVTSPMQAAVDAALLRHFSGVTTASFAASFTNFAHPENKSPGILWDAFEEHGPDFLYIVFSFNMCVQLSHLMQEKEHGLREIMAQMGASRAAYWVSWLLWCIMSNTILTFCLCLMGYSMGLDFFVENSFGLYFFAFFLSTTALSMMAFFFSTISKTSNGANGIAFAWFLLTFLVAKPLSQFYLQSDEYGKSIGNGLSVLPVFPTYLVNMLLGGESQGEANDGMKWSERDSVTGDRQWYTVVHAYSWLLLGSLILAVTTWYLDHVIPNVMGNSQPLWFPFLPSYWIPSVFSGKQSGRCLQTVQPGPQDVNDDDSEVDADVVAESAAVKAGNFGERNIAVVIHGLRKVFGGGLRFVWKRPNTCSGSSALSSYFAIIFIAMFARGGAGAAIFGAVIGVGLAQIIAWSRCCFILPEWFKVPVWLKFAESFTAVDGLDLSIDKDQVLVILGHNGAGKTTTINMMTGFMNMTEGDIIINNTSVADDFSSIRRTMGVCPQHDVLWDQLSGREHLALFAGIKGIPKNEVEGEITRRLEQVLLTAAADVPAGKYSGGMRRRLSIAIALIGDPKLVVLDEPTTGMDPVTRREVWDMIKMAKRGRSLILTTHSMEEADVLGDRVAIMSRGKLQAVGTSLRLKRKFGGGFRLMIHTNNNSNQIQITNHFKNNLPAATVSDTVSGTIQFRVPDDTEGIANFLRDLESKKSELGIARVSVGQATLEDVFLNLALAADHEDEDGKKEKKDRIDECDEAICGCCVSSSSDDVTQIEIPTAPAVANEHGLKVGSKGKVVGLQSEQASPFNGKMVTILEILADGKLVVDLKWPSGENVNLIHTNFEKIDDDDDDDADADAGTASPSATREEPAVPPPDSAGESGSGSVVRASWLTQSRTLSSKQGSYQKRQKFQMCGVVMMPVLMLIFCVVLDKLVFQPETDKVRDDIDMNCMRQQVQTTYHKLPDIYVGIQSLANKYQFADADNVGRCNWKDSEAARWEGQPPCLAWDYEQRNYQILVGGQVDQMGSRSAGRSGSLTSWWNGLNTRAVVAKTCQHTFDDTVRDDTGLSNAQQWKQAQAGNYVNVGIGACQKSTSSNNRPPDADLNRLLAEEVKLAACRTAAYSNITAMYGSVAPGLTDLPTTIATSAATITAQSTGVWQHLSLATYEEDMMETYNLNLATSAMALLEGAFTLQNCSTDGINTANCQTMAAARDRMRVPSTTAAMYSNPFPTFVLVETLCSDSMLMGFIASAVGNTYNYDTTQSNTIAVNFCAHTNNRDVVRNVNINHVAGGKNEIDNALFDRWQGELSNDFSLASFTAYYLNSANVNTLQFDFNVFLNFTGLSLGLFYGNSFVGYETGDPSYQQHSAQMTLHNAIFKEYTNYSLQSDRKTFPQYFNENLVGDPFGGRNIVEFLAFIFLPYVICMYEILIVGQMVFEKSSRLREIMIMNGLQLNVYFVVTYMWYFMQFMMMILFTWLISGPCGLTTFTLHQPGLVFFFYFSWGHCLVSFSFMISTFLKSDKMAIVVAVLSMFVFVETSRSLLSQLTFRGDVEESEFVPFMLFAPVVAIRGIQWFVVSAFFGQRLTFANMDDSTGGALPNVMAWMWAHWLFSLVVTWYCQKVFAVGGGVPQHPLFFLGIGKSDNLGTTTTMTQSQDQPDDVKAEQERLEQSTDDDNVIVKMLGLRKIFPRAGEMGDKVAVKSLYLGVNRSECLGLLGHNGAGKTTAINMLCGLFPPTAGKATIHGLDIATQMAVIQRQMGICPQHDLLWPTLTAREHVRFYGRLKGLSGKQLQSAVKESLKDVGLLRFADRFSGKFSGGMKRRLSVACSLIGNPGFVIMDEPSTGLDPASRRQLWQVISKAKKSGNKSIILTTHSMEEADVLCDRLAIMSEGELMCVGHSDSLKQRYGQGFTFTLAVSDVSSQGVAVAAQRVRELMPSAKELNEPMNGTLSFEVDQADVNLADVFEAMDTNREEWGVVDWCITDTSLEEVFLKVALSGTHFKK